MRKLAAPILVGLGSFLLIAGVLALAWGTEAVKKTPLDISTETRLSGEAAKIDPTSDAMDPRPIFAQSVTKVDSEASTDETAVFAQWSCAAFGETGDCLDPGDPNLVLLPKEQLVSATDSIFATDRVSAEGLAADDLPRAAVEAGATATEGLVNKFPFDTEKKTYPYWDATTGTAVDAVYDRTEQVEGLTTYVFRVEISNAPIEIAEGTPGTYSSTKELFVEPATGALLNQTEDQQRWLQGGRQALDLSLAFTDDQVASSAQDAKDNRRRLALITTVVPLVGLIGGTLLIALGLLVAVRSARRSKEPVEERDLVHA